MEFHGRVSPYRDQTEDVLESQQFYGAPENHLLTAVIKDDTWEPEGLRC